MSTGWILDTSAVFDQAQRAMVVAVLPEAFRKSRKIVLPTHVLMELARQEVRVQRRATPNPGAVLPDQVMRELQAELAGVELLDFTGDDAVALLRLLDTKGDSHWDEVKLMKAITDGWLPIREAFLDLPVPACGHTLRDCGCPHAIWRKNDRGMLKSAAEAKGRALAQAGQAWASSTIDWLTVAMAHRHQLTSVTSDKNGHEWRWIPWISPTELPAAIRAAP